MEHQECIYREETVSCPKCGSEIRCRIVSGLTPACREIGSLMKGTLNVFACSECGMKFKISEPLYYSDAEHGFFMVQEDFPEDGGSIEDIEKEVDATMTDLAYAQQVERPTVRLVFSRDEFIEKLALVRAGFDDRMIEYAKFQLFQSAGEGKLNHTQHRLLYDFSDQDEKLLKFIVFEKEGNKAVSRIHFTREDYDRMCCEFNENETLRNELDALFPDCYVNIERLYDYA